ncbi:MAG: HAMP domain-containing histidine kinase [Cellulomonadaceae bacterium]|jgi:two-component system OmpR family sensor kinase|nr:HAMP domain-containing histidine kinase [Cellulomonadaceae bacterium]
MTGRSHRLDKWPLRAKLVAFTAALLALSLALAGLLTGTILSQYLVSQVDNQLIRTSGNMALLEATMGPDRGPSDYYVLVRDEYGQTQDSTWEPNRSRYGIPNLENVAQVVPNQPNQPGPPMPFTVDSVGAEIPTQWRVLATPVRIGRRPNTAATVYVALPLNSVAQATDMLRRTLVLSSLGIIGLGSLAALALVNRSLRPLRQIEHTAAAIAAGDLTQRVPNSGSPNTEVGSLEASLNAMLAQVEQSFVAQQAVGDRMKRFVSDASHELRTPLATVRGYSELYRMGGLPEAEVPQTMTKIEDAARRMGGLVEELLTLARLDEGRPMRSEPVDLTALVRDAAEDLHALNPERPVTLQFGAGVVVSTGSASGSGVVSTGLNLKVSTGDAGVVSTGLNLKVSTGSTNGDVVVPGDRDRLWQVLTNLIGNVARHTPDTSPVEIVLRASDSLGGDGQVVLEVIDHGNGVSETELAKIFERFYRADESRARASGGSGLGLAIVAAIVTAHGGTVRAENTPGGGLTIIVTLPRG